MTAHLPAYDANLVVGKRRLCCKSICFTAADAVNVVSSAQVGRVTANLPAYEANLVVVGEHTLFALNSRGQMIMQKRLDYHPMCCTVSWLCCFSPWWLPV